MKKTSMSKKKKASRVAAPVAEPVDTPPVPVAQAKSRRRRRRSKLHVLAARTISDIKAKERQFLREVSQILTEALGFPVKVSHVKVQQPMTPDMRRASRMTRTQARRQVAEAFAPLDRPARSLLHDVLPI